MFEQYASALHQKYPGLEIQGDNYPPPTIKHYLAQTISAIKLILIICIVAGQNPFEWMGVETPNLYTYAIENKVYACLMLFFVCNAVEGQLISTGAFEISFNEQPVWSKLETGRIPQPNEMVQIVDNQMNMAAGKFSGGNYEPNAFDPNF